METSTRSGRWLVSGVLGLAVLGAAGCSADANPSSQQAGPAVVLNAPADSGLSKPPSSKTADVRTTGGAGTAISAVTPDRDVATKKVPAAKPKSINDTPDSPPSADTP
ncbi:MAG TPA: hypothetical protein PKA07_04135 [Micropruina sp.]|nr:hypothetical protein [Micropruina sp.]